MELGIRKVDGDPFRRSAAQQPLNAIDITSALGETRGRVKACGRRMCNSAAIWRLTETDGISGLNSSPWTRCNGERTNDANLAGVAPAVDVSEREQDFVRGTGHHARRRSVGRLLSDDMTHAGVPGR